jgi:transposase
MWTEEHRRIYRREGGGYPSDLRDAEWARLEPLIPPARPGGRPRKTDMRAAVNAILYLLRTGCPWRYLPRESFPPRSTVYDVSSRLPARTRTTPPRGWLYSQLAQSGHTNRLFSRPLSVMRWSARGSPEVRRKPVSGTATPSEKALLVWCWQAVQWHV